MRVLNIDRPAIIKVRIERVFVIVNVLSKILREADFTDCWSVIHDESKGNNSFASLMNDLTLSSDSLSA